MPAGKAHDLGATQVAPCETESVVVQTPHAAVAHAGAQQPCVEGCGAAAGHVVRVVCQIRLQPGRQVDGPGV